MTRLRVSTQPEPPITSQQLRQLVAGDVVRLSPAPGTPSLHAVIEGELHHPIGMDGELDPTALMIGPLGLGGLLLVDVRNAREGDETFRPPTWTVGMQLEVVLPSPALYVNHRRQVPTRGDVVRDADDDDTYTWVFNPKRPDDTTPWASLVYPVTELSDREGLPRHLRLLVDGETGDTVPDRPGRWAVSEP